MSFNHAQARRSAEPANDEARIKKAYNKRAIRADKKIASVLKGGWDATLKWVFPRMMEEQTLVDKVEATS